MSDPKGSLAGVLWGFSCPVGLSEEDMSDGEGL